MFLFDKSNTTSSLHITNEMQNPKRNEKKQNLKSFTNKKDSARKAEKATDTRPPYYYCINDFLFMYCKVLLCTQHTHKLFTCMEKRRLNDEKRNYAG